MSGTHDLREHLVAISRRAYERGLVAGISGNNSVRVPGQDAALIKVTGVCQGEMTTDDTVLVSLDGVPLEDRAPSKEVRWHLAIYRANPDVGGIRPATAHAVAYGGCRCTIPPTSGLAR